MNRDPGRVRRRVPPGVFQAGPKVGPLHREVGPGGVPARRQRDSHHIRPEEDTRKLHGGRHNIPPKVQILPQEEHGILGYGDPVSGGPREVGGDKGPDDGKLHRGVRRSTKGAHPAQRKVNQEGAQITTAPELKRNPPKGCLEESLHNSLGCGFRRLKLRLWSQVHNCQNSTTLG